MLPLNDFESNILNKGNKKMLLCYLDVTFKVTAKTIKNTRLQPLCYFVTFISYINII